MIVWTIVPFWKACFHRDEATKVFLAPTKKRNTLGAMVECSQDYFYIN